MKKIPTIKLYGILPGEEAIGLQQLIHSADYAKSKGITLNNVNKRRERDALKDNNFFLKGGYYFVVKEE